jgi:hypothetical protein
MKKTGWAEMTQVMQPVGMPQFARDATEKCWFHEEEADQLTNGEEESPPSPEGNTESAENGEHNDASVLGSSLAGASNPQPTDWAIKHKVDPEDPIAQGDETKVSSAAHHLLPGNASVNKADGLHKYMVWKGKNPKGFSGPVGYDINNALNGVWLPGNYAVRRGTQFHKNWSDYKLGFQNAYAIAAMKGAQDKQLHDAHPTYNGKVLDTLNDIAKKLDAMWKDQTKCPVCGADLKDKARPPYGIVGRMNALSQEHKKPLEHPEQNRKFVRGGYYTSSRVLLVYGPAPVVS